MNIPKSIKVGGHVYEVHYPYKFKERWDRLGFCNDLLKALYIADDDGNGNRRSDSAVLVTFIHEVLHAIDNVMGHGMFSDTEGEKRVEGLSEGIYQVLVDNGWLKDAGKDKEA